MSFFNQLKNKAEELNKKHNIIPIGQNHQQQHQPPPPQGYYAPSPHQTYPGQHQQQPPPPGSWEQQQQQQQQQQPAYGNQYSHAGAPPPIPFHSRPGGTPSGASPGIAAPPPLPPPPPPSSGIYWRPTFSPEVPVWQEFEHKEGHGTPWGWGNNELQCYTSAAANSFHTADGKLVVRALARPGAADPEARWTSARLVSRRALGRADGRLTAVLSLPCAEGVWPACWLLPREPFAWPREGEVDVAETWNGDRANRSCLHWGFYGTPEDAAKHLVRETRVPDMARRPVRFDFAWRCGGTGLLLPPPADGQPPSSAGGGRLMWYVDGRPVMRNLMPAGTRPIEDWCVLLNVAMGGNVCQGKVPREGAYDMVVHELHMSDAPEGGWGKFDADWQHCVDGAIM